MVLIHRVNGLVSKATCVCI